MTEANPGYEPVKVFYLLGHQDLLMYDNEDPETLPADLMGVNFAEKKLSQSTAEWIENSEQVMDDARARGRADGHEWGAANGEAGVSMTREDSVKFSVVTLLGDHCAGGVALEQAANLFADLRDLELATEVVESTQPSKWPARALAQRILKVLDCIMIPYEFKNEEGGIRPRPYGHEKEISAQITRILSVCDSMVGQKIEGRLRTYFSLDSTPGLPPKDLKFASQLLAFCDNTDLLTMSSIISALGASRMPPAAISHSLLATLKEDNPMFLQTIQDDTRRRFSLRSTPSLFPMSRKISSRRQASVSPARSKSPDRIPRARTPPPRAFIKEEDFEMFDVIPASASAPSSPKKFSSPLPEPKHGHSVIMQISSARPASSKQGGSAHQASHSSSRKTPSGSVVNFSHRYTEEVIGNGPERFKWWNMILEDFTSVEDLSLFGEPAPGDVLTYWDRTHNQAGAYVYFGRAWERVSTDYFANTGKILHPGYDDDDPRVLTWRSRGKLQPSWVKADYFRSHKAKLGKAVLISLDQYNRTVFSDKRPGAGLVSFVGDAEVNGK